MNREYRNNNFNHIMFGLFRKKKDDWQERFEADQKRWHEQILPIFQAMAEKLPFKYAFLKERFDSDLLISCNANIPYASNFHDHAFVFGTDPKKEKKFQTAINNYAIQNIQIYSRATNQWEKFSLHIMNNIPVAFVVKAPNWNFDLEQIDVSNITEKHFGNLEFERWSPILGRVPSEHKEEIDVLNGFEIESDDGKYFTIHDFGDGDYIAIKETGEIYGLIHGRNIREKIFDSPKEFFDALNKKEFDFLRYYESRV